MDKVKFNPELDSRLLHIRPIFKNDNAEVYAKIEEATYETSVESTIKSFSRLKDERGAFQSFVSYHAGEAKNRATSKKKLNLLQKN